MQKPILNFSPRGKLLCQVRSCPMGVKLSPGVKFSVRPSILLYSRECSPLGVNQVVNIPPRGQIAPLGARGEVKNGPRVYHELLHSSMNKDDNCHGLVVPSLHEELRVVRSNPARV
jgi:hypothetical protein